MISTGLRYFVLSTSLAAAGAAFGGSYDQVIRFEEQPGVLEFSGRLVARPVQVSSATGKKGGLSPIEAAVRAEAARIAMADFNVFEYRVETDEYFFEVPAGSTEMSIANELMASGNFEYVEPDWICYPLECPNDSRFGSQWHHDKMESCLGWDTFTGDSSISVGICDTGVRTTHEDLAANRLEGYNAVDRRWESAGGRIDDVNGHGTMTTGCAAAQGNNGVGVSGMGWTFSHRMLRVSNSSGGSAFQSTLTHAALTAVQAGDRIASVSYSGVNSSSVRTTGAQIKDEGGLLFWSAGNDSRNLSSPNRDQDDVIVVGASTPSDNKANFSAYGNYVDVFAPGTSIWAPTRSSNNSYGRADGTSFAGPLAAGLGALIWSYNPSLTPDEVEEAIKQGCDDLGSSGVDNVFGYGRINVAKSLDYVGSARLFFDTDSFHGGDRITAFVVNGDPETDTGLFYSLRGEGGTFVPDLGITIGLDNARMIGGMQQTNSIGDVFWNLRLPNVPRARLAWVQAGQSTGRLSNIELIQINP